MMFTKSSLILLFLFIVNFATAQNTGNILGKWQNEEEGTMTKCYFFEHKGKLHGLVYYYKDNDKTFSLTKVLKDYQVEKIEDLSGNDIFEYLGEYVWFKDFKKYGKEWNGSLIYNEKGENSAFESTLKSIDQDKLEVSYTYLGTSYPSDWQRIL